jgi:hypothetical protein
MMTTLKTVTIVAVLLVGGASLAMAQNGLPTGGERPVAGGANGGGWAGGWYPGYGYGYGGGWYAGAPAYGYGYGGYGYTAAPLYDYATPAYGYASPAYAAPASAGTTIIIVTPSPAYTAPPVASGYYNYAPGYWGGYGWGRAGYWWR